MFFRKLYKRVEDLELDNKVLRSGINRQANIIQQLLYKLDLVSIHEDGQLVLKFTHELQNELKQKLKDELNEKSSKD